MFGLATAAVALAVTWLLTRPYVRAVCTPGRVSPPAPRLFRTLGRAVARAIVFVQVGRVTVRGFEHVAAVDGPAVIAANHGHYADGLILGLTIGAGSVNYYFMVAHGALRWGGGLGALMIGPSGTIAVDLRAGRGGTALRTGAKLLESGERVALFPEGWAHMDGRRAAFKPGAVWMARWAARRRQRPVPIVPVAITYPRHPGRWITRLSPAAQYVLTFVAFPVFRRGATITIGEPLWPTALPSDLRAAADRLESTIHALAGGLAS